MAYCTNCQHQLGPTDKFCPECGTPVRGGVGNPRWEYCEIKAVDFPKEERETIFGSRTHVFQFQAIGINAQGEHVVSTSDKFKIKMPQSSYVQRYSLIRSEDEVKTSFDALVRSLSTSGWEVLPDKGNNWWNYKFRRLERVP